MQPIADAILPDLRAGTAAAHARLEENVRIEERISSSASYIGLLQRFYGFYEPLERLLSALPGWGMHGVDFAARHKTPWLERDLAALDHSPEQIAALPRCTHLPAMGGLHHGFGCAYVLEGATLGGRQISALLQTSRLPEGARNFFQSYGAEVGARWREFLAALEGFAAQAGESRAEIVTAASQTFSCLELWLAEDRRP